jgi:hypothetical protein
MTFDEIIILSLAKVDLDVESSSAFPQPEGKLLRAKIGDGTVKYFDLAGTQHPLIYKPSDWWRELKEPSEQDMNTLQVVAGDSQDE